MALPPSDPGRTGPYWRRQQHTTLPGEWTGAQLAAENAARARVGLAPLGGPAPPHAAAPVRAPRFSLSPAFNQPGLTKSSGMSPVSAGLIANLVAATARPVAQRRPQVGGMPLQRRITPPRPARGLPLLRNLQRAYTYE